MGFWLLGIGVVAAVIGAVWRIVGTVRGERAAAAAGGGPIRRAPGSGWFIIAGLAAVVVGGFTIPSAPGTTFRTAEAPTITTGCSASRRAVESRLKAPATAAWGDCRSTTSGGVQTVTLSVDSQNGFGALIRSTWVTTVRDNVVESIAQSR